MKKLLIGLMTIWLCGGPAVSQTAPSATDWAAYGHDAGGDSLIVFALPSQR